MIQSLRSTLFCCLHFPYHILFTFFHDLSSISAVVKKRHPLLSITFLVSSLCLKLFGWEVLLLPRRRPSSKDKGLAGNITRLSRAVWLTAFLVVLWKVFHLSLLLFGFVRFYVASLALEWVDFSDGSTNGFRYAIMLPMFVACCAVL